MIQALRATMMELTLWAEQQNALDVGENVRGGGHFTRLVKMQAISNKAWLGSRVKVLARFQWAGRSYHRLDTP